MSLGPFHSSSSTYVEDSVSSFFYNKSLQQSGLELRLSDLTDDVRHDIRLVGGALIAQQEEAARRHEGLGAAMRVAIEGQTREVLRARQEASEHAHRLHAILVESSDALRRDMQDTTKAVEKVGSVLSGQLAHVECLLAEQNQVLADIFHLLRESRSNECRQLVEQGERLNSLNPQMRQQRLSQRIYEVASRECREPALRDTGQAVPDTGDPTGHGSRGVGIVSEGDCALDDELKGRFLGWRVVPSAGNPPRQNPNRAVAHQELRETRVPPSRARCSRRPSEASPSRDPTDRRSPVAWRASRGSRGRSRPAIGRAHASRVPRPSRGATAQAAELA